MRLTALAIILALPCAAAAQGLQLRVVSNPRPEFVSGGDVLVGVTLPAGVQPSAVHLTLNGLDVSSALRADASGRTVMALVTGLNDGSNALVATAGKATSKLTVVNHPNAGPVISGPHEQPFVCETDKFTLMSGGVAGKPLDAECSIATRVDYVYKSTAPPAATGRGRGAAASIFKPLTDLKNLPSDVAMTTTSLGVQAPFIVRVETGTINRGVYEIAMLFNPAKDAQPDFMTKPSGWNGRLIYTFGGGCAGGWYKQGTGTGGVDDEVMLQQGYAVASNSLNVMGNDCAELMTIESMMMTKEHFIEAYGAPKLTLGFGGSGATYQQHQIGDGYPGLLDGLIVQRSFPDMEFGTVGMISDARLLANYFDKLAAAVTFTDEQKRQVAGLGQIATLKTNSLNPGRITVGEYCSLPENLRYDAVKNPTGARCDVYDHAVNVWGKDPKTGFARRPLDNVGIQYGLGALNAGVISKQQFLDLNAKIGGYDNDGKVVAARTVADPAAIRIAYRMGRMTWGGAGLATTPILDYRAYLDDAEGGNIHLRYHSFSTRERLHEGERLYGQPRDAHRRPPVGRFAEGARAEERARADGSVADEDRRRHLEGLEARQAPPREAGRPGRRVLDARRASAEDRRAAAADLGQVQRALPGELVPARRRRQPARGRRHQVPAEARVGVGLQGDVHGRRDGAAEADLPGRRLRLVEARRRSAADGGHLAVPPGGAAEYRDAIGNIRGARGSRNKKGRVRKDPPCFATSLLPTSNLLLQLFHFSTFPLRARR